MHTFLKLIGLVALGHSWWLKCSWDVHWYHISSWQWVQRPNDLQVSFYSWAQARLRVLGRAAHRNVSVYWWFGVGRVGGNGQEKEKSWKFFLQGQETLISCKLNSVTAWTLLWGVYCGRFAVKALCQQYLLISLDLQNGFSCDSFVFLLVGRHGGDRSFLVS